MSKILNLKQLSSTSLIALVTLATVPVAVQARPYSVTCQATIAVGRGASLTYRLAGTIPETTSEATPQNPIGTTLTLTVQQRDRAGRVRTLLNGSILKDYQELAPDGDYSKLPFEGTFRGQPNNGTRLYKAPASANGIYVSLRPTSGKPQRMQILHYLRGERYLRSPAGTCQTQDGNLNASIDKQLAALQKLLQAKDWAGAEGMSG